MTRKTAEFRPELEQAQATLEGALKEACAMDLRNADTGGMIHIDELLAIAGESAKQVISVRRRLRSDAEAKSRADKPAQSRKSPPRGLRSQATSEGSVNSTTGPAAPSRSFEDARRVRWTTFEVHPSTARARLPGQFQGGWLSFDSGSETRRLSPIPERWHLLTDDELRDLCVRAEASPRRPSKGAKAD